MIAHFNIEQGSIEWHEIRHCKIGGTRAKELFIKSDTLFYKILAETIEPFDEDFEEGYKSEAMQRGNDLEPLARSELSAYTGYDFIECGWLQHENDLLGISPDGITSDLTIQCEIKSPQPIAHLKMCVSNEVADEYIGQVIHAFTVNQKLEKLYFLSFRPECKIKPMFVKEFTRDSLVNAGTKAKPVMKSIFDMTRVAIREAEFLQEQIEQTINQLNF